MKVAELQDFNLRGMESPAIRKRLQFFSVRKKTKLNEMLLEGRTMTQYLESDYVTPR